MQDIDVATVTEEELSYDVPFTLTCRRDDYVHGVCVCVCVYVCLCVRMSACVCVYVCVLLSLGDSHVPTLAHSLVLNRVTLSSLTWMECSPCHAL